MIKCSIYAGEEDIQPFKERLESLGCSLSYYHEEHKVYQKIFNAMTTKPIRVRMVNKEKLIYMSPPDTNASRRCTIQNVEETKILTGDASKFLTKILGFSECKTFNVVGFECKLEKLIIKCFQCKENQFSMDWIIQMTLEKSDKIEKDFEFYENKLWSFTRFFPLTKFHHIDSLYIQ